MHDYFELNLNIVHNHLPAVVRRPRTSNVHRLNE